MSGERFTVGSLTPPPVIEPRPREQASPRLTHTNVTRAVSIVQFEQLGSVQRREG
jgi:hypothetical protein